MQMNQDRRPGESGRAWVVQRGAGGWFINLKTGVLPASLKACSKSGCANFTILGRQETPQGRWSALIQRGDETSAIPTFLFCLLANCSHHGRTQIPIL